MRISRYIKNIMICLLICCLLAPWLITPAKATETESEPNNTFSSIIEALSPYEHLKKAIKNRKTYDEVPLYFQGDYPDVPYSHGTVATSGCGITCLAMVATYLTDTEYCPGELGRLYNKSANNNRARMEYASNDIGLKMEKKTDDWDEVIAALKNEQVVIIVVGGASVFTDNGHFIVLTGISEDGKIFVNDPSRTNNNKKSLKDGYENGFEEKTVKTGFAMAWIYEKKPEKLTVEELSSIWASLQAPAFENWEMPEEP